MHVFPRTNEIRFCLFVDWRWARQLDLSIGSSFELDFRMSNPNEESNVEEAKDLPKNTETITRRKASALGCIASSFFA